MYIQSMGEIVKKMLEYYDIYIRPKGSTQMWR